MPDRSIARPSADVRVEGSIRQRRAPGFGLRTPGSTVRATVASTGALFPPRAEADPRVRSTCSRSRGFDSRWTAVAVVAVVLLVGSLVPSPFRRHPAFRRIGPDKLLHLVGHAGFAATVADALDAGRLSDRDGAALAVCVSAGYGIVIGHAQRYVPGREPESADLVAGVLGAVLGVLGRRYGYRSGAPPSPEE